MTDTLIELKHAIIQGNDDTAIELTKKALLENLSPTSIVDNAIVAGIQEAGELWKNNEYFLSDVIMCAEAFQAGMEILEPHLSKKRESKIGKYLIGTVAGDMHNLGKLIVVAMLRSAGFDVVDLGEDVSMQTFIDEVQKIKPDILGLGGYMTTTLNEMRLIIDNLIKLGIRDELKIMIGGIPTSQKFAEEIGADGWGSDALEAVDIARQLMFR